MQKKRFQLESIDLVNIVSTPEYNNFIKPFSWEVSAAVKRFRFDENNRPLLANFKAGFGVSYLLQEDTLISVFANVTMMIGSEFNQYIALAGGGRVQAISTVTDFWQVDFYAQVMSFFQGITQTSYSFGSTQRISLNPNNAMLINIGKTREFGDSFFTAGLSWQLYF